MKHTMFITTILVALLATGCQKEEMIIGLADPIELSNPKMYFTAQGGSDSTTINYENVYLNYYLICTPTDTTHNDQPIHTYKTLTHEWFTIEILPHKLKITLAPNDTPEQRQLQIAFNAGNAYGALNITQAKGETEAEI